MTQSIAINMDKDVFIVRQNFEIVIQLGQKGMLCDWMMTRILLQFMVITKNVG